MALKPKKEAKTQTTLPGCYSYCIGITLDTKNPKKLPREETGPKLNPEEKEQRESADKGPKAPRLRPRDRKTQKQRCKSYELLQPGSEKEQKTHPTQKESEARPLWHDTSRRTKVRETENRLTGRTKQPKRLPKRVPSNWHRPVGLA